MTTHIPVVSETNQHSASAERSVGSFGRNIIRVEHDRDRPYLMIAKGTLCDHSTPFDARGFLCFLLTKPDDWDLRPDQLAKETGLSVPTVYRLLKKLIEARYVRRELMVRRKPDGTFDSTAVYVVFESRQALESTPSTIPGSSFDDNGIPF